jgi:L-2-hydroxyglutarate oxidase LhgO
MRSITGHEVCIIGGGIIGLQIARQLKLKNKDLRILVLEKESRIGVHASGLNSGVLHAGFYYTPDSLKASYCRTGNALMKEYCQSRGIKVLDVGKVVVARNDSEAQQLEKLYERGLKNEVQLELRPAADLIDFEPLAKTYEKFIWSPTTAVVNPIDFLNSLFGELSSMGVDFIFNSKVEFVADNEVFLNGTPVKAKHIVNSSGTQADIIAKAFGYGDNYRMLPFLGLYREISHMKVPLRSLVYPVPNPHNPFLGVHFTITTHGRTKIGPTAIPILGKEQYSIKDNVSFQEIRDALRSVYSVATNEKHSLLAIALNEVPKFRERNLIKLAGSLLNEELPSTGWSKRQPGIRSQLVDITSGELAQDFIIEGDSRSTHVLNAVSPAWTASPALAENIAELILAKIEG